MSTDPLPCGRCGGTGRLFVADPGRLGQDDPYTCPECNAGRQQDRVTGPSAERDPIAVPASVLIDVCEWWRAANEAPGGCSAFDAIKGMGQAVGYLVGAIREAGHEV